MSNSFTLIEILVVIVIIGILSAFILVGMSSITNSANIAKGKAFADSTRNSLLGNLKAEIKLDEGTGQNIGDSWNSVAGFLGATSGVEASDPSWSSDCISKNCLNLGDDDFIKLSDNSNLHFPGDVTISMWIYNGVTSQTAGTLINKGVQSNINPYWYAYTNYGSNKKSVFWQFTNGITWNNVSWTGVIEENKWSHLVFMYNHSNHNITLYVNGVSKGIKSTTDSLAVDNTSDLYIGTYQGNTTTYNFKGKFDEIVFFDSVIMGINVENNYFSGLNKLFKNRNISSGEYTEKLSEFKISIGLD